MLSSFVILKFKQQFRNFDKPGSGFEKSTFQNLKLDTNINDPKNQVVIIVDEMKIKGWFLMFNDS